MTLRRLALAALLSGAAFPALAEVPVVATDIPPVHSLVAQVMAGVGEPVLLLEQGADAHDYQLRPSQAQALSDAALVVWMGPGMSPWLERALEAGGGARSLPLLAAEGTFLRQFGESAGEHNDAADHAGEAEHDDHGHDHEGTDPHAWLDPANAMLWLDLIAAELAAADPANAAAYAANSEDAKARVAELDASIGAALDPVRDMPIVVFHDAYGYFADHYGLTVAGTVALGDAADPGAERLAAVRASLVDVACIFPEAQHDPKLIEQLAEGTDVRIGGALDPEGRELTPGPDLYFQLMTGLGDTIAACLTQS